MVEVMAFLVDHNHTWCFWGQFREREGQENAIGYCRVVFGKKNRKCEIMKTGRASEDEVFIHHPRAKNRPSRKRQGAFGLFLYCKTDIKVDTSIVCKVFVEAQVLTCLLYFSVFGSRKREGRAHEAVAMIFRFRSDTRAHRLS